VGPKKKRQGKLLGKRESYQERKQRGKKHNEKGGSTKICRWGEGEGLISRGRLEPKGLQYDMGTRVGN